MQFKIICQHCEHMTIVPNEIVELIKSDWTPAYDLPNNSRNVLVDTKSKGVHIGYFSYNKEWVVVGILWVEDCDGYDVVGWMELPKGRGENE